MLTTGEALGLLRAIEHEVRSRDIPNYANCAAHHHEACQDIVKYIERYIALIKKYDGIPSISDMYPTIHVTLYDDSDPVPADPDEYLKREV